eukprot:TRINITY_DN1423_c0_g3_i1.p7 TRINITY_DN1423_c0_g3~~TRINITY_DN1423_c0_g3_i1.p7  ORF type:complete len:100 (-),score=10.77 TRINITY_DN1423_c0_g3_i1:542-841(-)
MQPLAHPMSIVGATLVTSSEAAAATTIMRRIPAAREECGAAIQIRPQNLGEAADRDAVRHSGLAHRDGSKSTTTRNRMVDVSPSRTDGWRSHAGRNEAC